MEMVYLMWFKYVLFRKLNLNILNFISNMYVIIYLYE